MQKFLAAAIVILGYASAAWASPPVVCQLEKLQKAMKYHEEEMKLGRWSEIYSMGIIKTVSFPDNGNVIFTGMDVWNNQECVATFEFETKAPKKGEPMVGCWPTKFVKASSTCPARNR